MQRIHNVSDGDPNRQIVRQRDIIVQMPIVTDHDEKMSRNLIDLLRELLIEVHFILRPHHGAVAGLRSVGPLVPASTR